MVVVDIPGAVVVIVFVVTSAVVFIVIVDIVVAYIVVVVVVYILSHFYSFLMSLEYMIQNAHAISRTFPLIQFQTLL